MTNANLRASIIIPFRNACGTLECCLHSIIACNEPGIEIILVNDGSRDESVRIAERFPCRIIHLDKNHGQSFARNKGAESAASDILIFMDADTEIMDKKSLGYLIDFLGQHKEFAAIQGVYSLECDCCDILSVYKHLYICYLQARRSADKSDLCTAFLGIRKDIFLQSGGFNNRLRASANEDTEFGLRLIAAGHKFYTEKTLKVKHNHHYGLKSFVKMEYFRSLNQAIMFLSNLLPGRRNTFRSQASYQAINFYLSLSLVLLFYSTLIIFPQMPLYIMPLILFLMVNIGFIGFIRRKTGFSTACLAYPILFFDLSVCLWGVAGGAGLFILKRERI